MIFFTYKLGIIWREWLSRSLISDYMSNKAYYVLNPNDEQETDVDNPDQRISDDTRAFTGQSLTFTLGVFDAILTKKFTVKISKRYSLEEAFQAHKDLEARLLTGPAVIIP